MSEEKDLSLAENNDFIPAGPEISQEDAENNLIRAEDKPQIGGYVLEKLGNGESVQIGNIIIQRTFKHSEGSSGGEEFSLLDMDNEKEKRGVTLKQLANIKTQEGFQDLFEE